MKILFMGAHPDDVEHGCGALLKRLSNTGNHEVVYSCFSKCDDLERNAGLMDEFENVSDALDFSVNIYEFPNRMFPDYKFDIREKMECLKSIFDPDLIITHSSFDIHQDHQTLHAEARRVFRNKGLLGFEVIRSCPGFIPQYYVSFLKNEIEDKVKLLHLYKTQMNMYYNTKDVIFSLAKTRGAEIGEKYAEGFEVIRLCGEPTCL